MKTLGLNAGLESTSRNGHFEGSLDRQLTLIEFAAARRWTRPYAERAGWLTDDDVFEAVS